MPLDLARLVDGEPNADDIEAILSAIRAWVFMPAADAAERGLAGVLGLTSAERTAEANRRKIEAARALARCYSADYRPTHAPALIRAALKRYLANHISRKELAEDSPPSQYVGTPHEYVWIICKVFGDLPSTKTIYRWVMV